MGFRLNLPSDVVRVLGNDDEIVTFVNNIPKYETIFVDGKFEGGNFVFSRENKFYLTTRENFDSLYSHYVDMCADVKAKALLDSKAISVDKINTVVLSAYDRRSIERHFYPNSFSVNVDKANRVVIPDMMMKFNKKSDKDDIAYRDLGNGVVEVYLCRQDQIVE